MSLAGIHAEQEFHAHPHAPQAAAIQEESTTDAQTPSLQQRPNISSRRLRRRTMDIMDNLEIEFNCFREVRLG